MQCCNCVDRAKEKRPLPTTFMNEAKLVNWALTGEFKSLDRESLPAGDLDLLARLEERNSVLIGFGLDRSERKTALNRFVNEWRTAHVGLIEIREAA